MHALAAFETIAVRTTSATQPWHYLLVALCVYPHLAEALATDPDCPCDAFNFGPQLDSDRPVRSTLPTGIQNA